MSDHLNFLTSIIENVTLELHHLNSKLRLTQSIISDINLLAKWWVLSLQTSCTDTAVTLPIICNECFVNFVKLLDRVLIRWGRIWHEVWSNKLEIICQDFMQHYYKFCLVIIFSNRGSINAIWTLIALILPLLLIWHPLYVGSLL